jgi:hypothetical protein
MKTVLEDTFQKCLGIENKFPKKKVLFIGSESYDGATITIIEGLHNLGFEILTFKKDNINSWFCNVIIDDLTEINQNVDFVLSNLHWGTRWSLYDDINTNMIQTAHLIQTCLKKVPYILIDGDDRIQENKISDWKIKYEKYLKQYKGASEEIKNKMLSPYRWMEPMLENYSPDVVFMSHKFKINTDQIYLPFGINKSYFTEQSINSKRTIDVCHIPGPGRYRQVTENILNNAKEGNLHDKNVWNQYVYGDMNVDDRIKNNCENDDNVHSWHRWRVCKDYQNTLVNSKINIISLINTYNSPGWESKRPYEGMAFGCFIMFQKQPDFDNQSYPIEEIDEDMLFKFEDYNGMIDKCKYLLENPDVLEEKRVKCHEKAMKYFTSEPITRYFLFSILEKVNL